MADQPTRTYQPDDAAAVAELFNLTAIAGGGQGVYTAGEIVDAMGVLVKDPATDTRLITDPDGRLVAVALVAVPPEGGYRVDLIGGVHPERCGQGIGRDLLRWQLERSAARHAEIAPDSPWLAEVTSSVPDTAAIRLVERFGFTAARYYLDMTAPVGPPPVAPATDGWRIAPMDPDRAREVHAVHAAAFQDAWGYQDRSFEAWAPLTVERGMFRPDLSRVALAGDEIVGYALSYDDGVPGRLYIGQVGTARAWRRRGVAGSLLAGVLDAAGRAGYAHAALDTDADSPTGAAGVYERVGFVVVQRTVAHRRTA